MPTKRRLLTRPSPALPGSPPLAGAIWQTTTVRPDPSTDASQGWGVEPMAVPLEFLTSVTNWIKESQLLTPTLLHAPGVSRLARLCLAPLAASAVGSAHSRESASRLGAVLDAARPGLRADLEAAHRDVRSTLSHLTALGNPADCLSADQIQTIIALRLRDLHASAWLAAAGTHPPLAPPPAWHDETGYLLQRLLTLVRARAPEEWVRAVAGHPAPEFQHAWTPTYLSMWQTSAPQERPDPAGIGLGELSQPDPVHTPAQLRNWRAATDRSAHDRLTLYWDSRHLPPHDPTGTGASLPAQRFATSTAPGRDLIVESLTRTCATFGLTRREHQSVLPIVAAAANLGVEADYQLTSQHVNQAWERLRDTPDELQYKQEMIMAVATAVQTKIRPTAVGRPHDPSEFAKYVVRRVWLRLHAWEVMGIVMPAREFSRCLGPAVDQAGSAEGVCRPGQRFLDDLSEVR